jgi:hypothetical protein
MDFSGGQEIIFILILHLFILIPALPAAEITPELFVKGLQVFRSAAFPDGGKLAFEVSEPAKVRIEMFDIWVFDGKTQELRRFAASPKSDNHPRWSSDGKHLAFLSKRSDSTQIYILPTDGGEAAQLTSGKRSDRIRMVSGWKADRFPCDRSSHRGRRKRRRTKMMPLLLTKTTNPPGYGSSMSKQKMCEP